MNAPATISCEATTIAQLVRSAIDRHGDRTALVDGPSGLAVDYRELGRRIDRIAAWLRDEGLAPGDRLAVWSPNLPPVAAFTIAALELGAAVVPLSPAWTEHEAGRIVRATGISMIVTIPPLAETALGFGVRRVVVLGEAPGATPLRDVLSHDGRPTFPDVAPDDAAFVCSSSGTTGAPKGVVLTHRQLVAVHRQIGDVLAVGETDVTLAVAPWFHILGLTAELLVPLGNGASVVTVPSFDPATFLALLERHAVTYLAVAPPIASAIVHHPSSATRDLTRLEVLAVGGAPLPPALQRALAERLPGCTIGQGWGLTETGGALCVPTRASGSAPGTVGRPLPGTEIRVIDPGTGTPLPDGSDGELVARGPQLMAGYLDRPDATAAAFTADGWLRTGDLGHVDPDGNVVVAGRLKDLIKVNALQVAPAEVEDVLLAHDGVLDAAVVGRPHERTGETPIAFIVTAGAIDLDALRATIDRHLAPYKRPTAIHVVERLPRTPSGKVLRHQL